MKESTSLGDRSSERNATWIEQEGSIRLLAADGRTTQPSSIDVWKAVFKNLEVLGGYSVASPTQDLPDIRFEREPARPKISVSRVESGMLRAVVVLTSAEVVVPYTQGTDSVIMKDVWFPVRASDADELIQLISRHALDSSGLLGIKQLISLRLECRSSELLENDLFQERRPEENRNNNEVLATLYPYQHEGVYFLDERRKQGCGSLLADEMGLGKTLQIIVLLVRAQHEHQRPSLVVAPATLIENWRREIARFAPSLRVLAHVGKARAGVAQILQRFDVVLVSYETMMRDESMFSEVSWGIVALDEAQNIKNPTATRTLAAKRLRAATPIAITGTPVENRLHDLWSIVDYCLPNLLGTLAEFEANYSNSEESAQELSRIVAPIVIRRRVAEVAKDLPELIESYVPILASGRLTDEYESLRGSLTDGQSKGAAFALLGKLRMLCAHGADAAAETEPIADSTKGTVLSDLCDESFQQGKKVLIFASYLQTSDRLLDMLRRLHPTAFVESIDGRVAVAERQGIIDSFGAFDGPAALILNPRAAGVGLNITAASHVVHFDPEWNPAVTDQASRRAYRRGQTQRVIVQHLYYVGTVEELVVSRSQAKRKLAEAAASDFQDNVDVIDLLQALKLSPAIPAAQ